MTRFKRRSKKMDIIGLKPRKRHKGKPQMKADKQTEEKRKAKTETELTPPRE